MSRAFDGTDEEWEELEAPLLEIDPELNIYALANGLDLLKNVSGQPGRTLEWYRDRLERRIRIVARGGDPPLYALQVGASGREEGVPLEVLRTVLDDAPFDELRAGLRGLVAEAVDRANALTRDELTTSAGPGAGAGGDAP